ncbi:MAG: energy transducer TonB [Pseudomonadota bacterium]|nr:energy transducer TonB [Pseudomonadota bacterium]
MVDTPNRNDENVTVVPPDTVVVEPRNRSSGLIWLVLLLALAALGWWWFSQRAHIDDDGTLPPMDGTATTAPVIGDGNALPEEDDGMNRDSTDRAATPRKPAAKPRQVAKATTPRIVAARPLNNPRPDYPAEAQRRGETGTVILRVNVNADGSAGDIDFVQRSGSQALDRAAQQAVRKWTFNPEMRGGVATASTVDVPVTFTLPPQ